jgi:hypothetical protein
VSDIVRYRGAEGERGTFVCTSLKTAQQAVEKRAWKEPFGKHGFVAVVRDAASIEESAEGDSILACRRSSPGFFNNLPVLIPADSL